MMSWQVPRYHFYKWSKDGSFERLVEAGVLKIKYELNLAILNLDGSHSAAKKGAKQSPIKAKKGENQHQNPSNGRYWLHSCDE